MRWFRFTALILLVTIVQGSILAEMSVGPNLLLVLLVFFATYYESTDAMIAAFAIGFAADLIGSPAMPMGPQTVSFGLLGTGLAQLHRVITTRRIGYQVVAIFITAALAGVLAQVLAYFKGRAPAPEFWTVIFGVALYSSLVGPFFFLPTAWWMRINTGRFARK